MRIPLCFDVYRKAIERSGQDVEEYLSDRRIETFAEHVVSYLDDNIKFRKIEENNDLMKFETDVYVFTSKEYHQIINALIRHKTQDAIELLRQ